MTPAFVTSPKIHPIWLRHPSLRYNLKSRDANEFLKILSHTGFQIFLGALRHRLADIPPHFAQAWDFGDERGHHSEAEESLRSTESSRESVASNDCKRNIFISSRLLDGCCKHSK